jgi:hypothetical protein
MIVRIAGSECACRLIFDAVFSKERRHEGHSSPHSTILREETADNFRKVFATFPPSYTDIEICLDTRA